MKATSLSLLTLDLSGWKPSADCSQSNCISVNHDAGYGNSVSNVWTLKDSTKRMNNIMMF